MATLIFLYVFPLIFVFLFVSWAFYSYDIIEPFYKLKDMSNDVDLWVVLIFMLMVGCIPIANIWLSYIIIEELLKQDD